MFLCSPYPDPDADPGYGMSSPTLILMQTLAMARAPVPVPIPIPVLPSSPGGDGVVYTWDLRTRRCRSQLVDHGNVDTSCLSLSRDGRYLATGACVRACVRACKQDCLCACVRATYLHVSGGCAEVVAMALAVAQYFI